MNAKLLAPLFAALFFSLPAHAHDCSGGTGGGMDATGNQCNDVAAVATFASSAGAPVSSDAAPKVAATKTASCSKCAGKHAATTKHATSRTRITRS